MKRVNRPDIWYSVLLQHGLPSSLSSIKPRVRPTLQGNELQPALEGGSASSR